VLAGADNVNGEPEHMVPSLAVPEFSVAVIAGTAGKAFTVTFKVAEQPVAAFVNTADAVPTVLPD